jgi:hypothetical protein
MTCFSLTIASIFVSLMVIQVFIIHQVDSQVVLGTNVFHPANMI